MVGFEREKQIFVRTVKKFSVSVRNKFTYSNASCLLLPRFEQVAAGKVFNCEISQIGSGSFLLVTHEDVSSIKHVGDVRFQQLIPVV